MKKKLAYISLGIAVLAVLLLLVFLIRGCSSATIENKPEEHNHSKESKVEIWTCAMHPFIRSNKPGKCPICGMTLIPLKEEEKDSNSPILTLSPEAVKLAEVQTTPVERKIARAEIRLIGKIEYNEPKTVTISARFPGRIEKLYLNYMGAYLNKGDHIAELFSPELYVLQRELIITKDNMEAAEKSENKQTLKSMSLVFMAAKNKAKIWGLMDEQINNILRKNVITQTLNLYSPISGVVIKQNFLQGQYFKEGDTLFVISDTSELWLMLDAYEQDITFLRYGQKVEFSVEAYPGEKFYGTIAYINPVLDESTRTVKIRVVVNNKDGKLKPGMFAHAVVFAQLGEKGIVMAPDLKGKWISPMHPEIIKDGPGKCDICGIDLVPSEKFIQADTSLNKKINLPLVIPSTAPLITGKRAVVYVENKPGAYEGREVVLGPKVGDFYIVNEGLKEGEKVVTNGNFKIDSELQILAKPSMMNPPPEDVKDDKVAEQKPTQNYLGNLYNNIWNNYFRIQTELTKANPKNAAGAAAEIKNALNSVNMDTLDTESHKKYMEIKEALTPILSKMGTDADIDGLRSDFLNLSDVYKNKILQDSKPSLKEEIYEFYCPMAANGKGGIWFQNTKEIANPYFDESMSECGDLKATYNSR